MTVYYLVIHFRNPLSGDLFSTSPQRFSSRKFAEQFLERNRSGPLCEENRTSLRCIGWRLWSETVLSEQAPVD